MGKILLLLSLAYLCSLLNIWEQGKNSAEGNVVCCIFESSTTASNKIFSHNYQMQRNYGSYCSFIQKAWCMYTFSLTKIILVLHKSRHMAIKVNYLTNLCVGSMITIMVMYLLVNLFKL